MDSEFVVLPIRQVELIVQQMVVTRGGGDEEGPGGWSVEYLLPNSEESALILVGALSGAAGSVFGHILVSAWVSWDGAPSGPDELAGKAEALYAPIKEPLYDLARRTLQAQAAVFDVSFDFPVKSPDIELGLGDGPDL